MVTLPIYHSNAGVIGIGSALIRYFIHLNFGFINFKIRLQKNTMFWSCNDNNTSL
jgi:hypothetical protein